MEMEMRKESRQGMVDVSWSYIERERREEGGDRMRRNGVVFFFGRGVTAFSLAPYLF